jgi:hypothetical protein
VQSFTGERSAVLIWREKRWSQNDRKTGCEGAKNVTKKLIACEPLIGLQIFFLHGVDNTWWHIVNHCGKVLHETGEAYLRFGAFLPK